MTAPAHVLVFDSGVGALSVIAEIKNQLPACSITYASDNAFYPYGEKEEGVLIERVDKVLKQLESQYKPNIIVVACNTASTVVLPKIRAHFKIATVGVVPAIRPAAQISQSKVIGLLATPATVKRPYTQDLIREFASDCKVISVGSTELVKQAEAKLRGQTTDPQRIKRVLGEIFTAEGGNQVDTIVLACTHFPLLKQELEAASSKNIQWVDSGEAIAKRVAYWIDEHKLQLKDPHYRSVFITDSDSRNTEQKDELNAELHQTLNQLLPGPIESITVP